ncbi:MAG: glutaredoxin family protein [Gammaproteobacteria bacterium]|nr:glutaredoxin family protein [Gammaproteobacteria bacterium]MBU1505894.1 glutaredoxin family protein [Gammaproteobacteria bacterium]MBU2123524.1 glutaredoxin family protein [Gammaproteobacteria bacterium]MBU2172512.1 glutaredoxin family protein [Gammaproteobacteria bacterium]MBU2201970.1 glutaredoxin family protein [Gammaproteobacteria bacterium]
MQKPLVAPLLASLLMALVSVNAQAQSVYRIVGPDGKVTFSDRPPADASAQPTRTVNTGPAAANATLPLELRQVTTRFPVTLYTGSDCAPCNSARNLLTSRGVPFTERTVSTNEDIAALQRLSGNSSLPFGTIGGQQLAGFSDTEWTQYLDAAGYPKQSQLPATYRAPAPSPLVAIKAAEPASATAPAPSSRAAAQRTRPPAPVNEGPTPSNPAGIRF